MNEAKTLELLQSEAARVRMTELYGAGHVDENISRYEELVKKFQENFGEKDILMFSSPGRTEISGNHTDHNHGKVLAGSINLDCVGIAAKNDSSKVNIISETFNQKFTIDLNELQPSAKKAGTIDLVKGLLKGFQQSGYEVGGFDAYITSNVISSAGVSSSASFEMLLCSMLNRFFNDGRMSTVAYAHIGKYAENVYWDKASGLLDQMACAVGGLITIDFLEPAEPKVEQIDFDFASQNHSLIIVQTGKGHADLSADYSSVPNEMKKVAQFFGKEVCAEVTEQQVIDNIQEVRAFAGDRSGRGISLEGGTFRGLLNQHFRIRKLFLEVAAELLHDSQRAGAGNLHCAGSDRTVHRGKTARCMPHSRRRFCRCHHGDAAK